MTAPHSCPLQAARFQDGAVAAQRGAKSLGEFVGLAGDASPSRGANDH